MPASAARSNFETCEAALLLRLRLSLGTSATATSGLLDFVAPVVSLAPIGRIDGFFRIIFIAGFAAGSHRPLTLPDLRRRVELAGKRTCMLAKKCLFGLPRAWVPP